MSDQPPLSAAAPHLLQHIALPRSPSCLLAAHAQKAISPFPLSPPASVPPPPLSRRGQVARGDRRGGARAARRRARIRGAAHRARRARGPWCRWNPLCMSDAGLTRACRSMQEHSRACGSVIACLAPCGLNAATSALGSALGSAGPELEDEGLSIGIVSAIAAPAAMKARAASSPRLPPPPSTQCATSHLAAAPVPFPLI